MGNDYNLLLRDEFSKENKGKENKRVKESEGEGEVKMTETEPRKRDFELHKKELSKNVPFDILDKLCVAFSGTQIVREKIMFRAQKTKTCWIYGLKDHSVWTYLCCLMSKSNSQIIKKYAR
jgi:hypothetical protein